MRLLVSEANVSFSLEALDLRLRQSLDWGGTRGGKGSERSERLVFPGSFGPETETIRQDWGGMRRGKGSERSERSVFPGGMRPGGQSAG
jgi:hypothetical protein